MKAPFIALAVSGAAEAAVFRSASKTFSGSLCVALMVVAILGSVLLGVFADRRRTAFLGSVVLAAPGISYSMLRNGFLEMGGFVHPLCFGILGLVSYAVARRRAAAAIHAPAEPGRRPCASTEIPGEPSAAIGGNET